MVRSYPRIHHSWQTVRLQDLFRNRHVYRRCHLQLESGQDIRQAQQRQQGSRSTRIPLATNPHRHSDDAASCGTLWLVRRVSTASIPIPDICRLDSGVHDARLPAADAVRGGRMRHIFCISSDRHDCDPVPGGRLLAAGNGGDD